MTTEKTRLLFAIARRRSLIKEIITRHAKFELTKRIIELARRARRENLVELDAIAVVGINRESNDPKAIFATVVREIFNDGVVHWGKNYNVLIILLYYYHNMIILLVHYKFSFFALTNYFQRHFDLELENKVIHFFEELFPDWMDNQQVLVGWDIVKFCTNSIFISLSIKLKATMFHLECKASALK